MKHSILLPLSDVEVETKNRELQAVADAAAADTTEITTLVEQHRALAAAHQQLQVYGI